MEHEQKTPVIKFWDLEVGYNVVNVFSLFEGRNRPINYQNIVQERSILTAAVKTLGEGRVEQFSVSPNRPSDDRAVCRKLSQSLSKADVLVAHFGDRFDLKWLNTRLLYHSMNPLPATIITEDTYKIAKSKFYFNSNKLDYLAKFLHVGEKIQTPPDLWLKVMQKDEEALQEMREYNKRDVEILEEVWKALRPYAGSAMKYSFASSVDQTVCPSCGSEHVQKRGFAYTKTQQYQRYRCDECGHWSRDARATKREEVYLR